MPGRRKTSTAVMELPETTEASESVTDIESVNKEEVDHHVKSLLDSASLAEASDTPQVADEDRLKELMAKMIHARDRAQMARERLRDINAELTEHNETVSEKIEDKYKNAVRELTSSRRAANLSRAELVVALKGWQRSLRMAY